MVVEKIAFLSLLGLAVRGYQCTRYEFFETKSEMDINQCAFYDNADNLVLLDPSICGGNTTCANNYTAYDKRADLYPIQVMARSVYCIEDLPPIHQTYKAHPGSKCSSNEDCLIYYYPYNSSKEIKGCNKAKKICEGFEKDEVFQSYFFLPQFCNPGLFAKKYNGVQNGYKCVDQYKKGHKCLRSYECSNDSVCVNRTCTEIGSVKSGTKLNVVDYYQPYEHPLLACETFYWEFLKWLPDKISAEYKCKDPPHSNNGQAAECQIDKDCIVTDGSYTSCWCGLSGKSHCSLAEGDHYSLEFNKFHKQWFFSPEVHNCNAIGRFQSQCILDYMNKNLSNYYIYYYIMKGSYHLIKDADEKLVKIFAPRIYSLNQTINGGNNGGNDEDSSRLIGILYALMVLTLA